MTIKPMRDLPRGTNFRTNLDDVTGGVRYEVVVPASQHPRGEVVVRNLSMTDAEAQQRLDTPGEVELGCGPREGAFCSPIDVEVLS